MNWRQRVFSNMFWRTALASFGERSGYSKEPGGFVPYFQYRIGPYHADLYLYFPKEPFPLLYKNEIFNKLQEYTGYDIIKYLDFHFAAYPDSQDFLRFLHYEICERLKRSPKNARLLSALSWVTEKKVEAQTNENLDFRSEIEKGVQAIIKRQPTATAEDIDNQVCTLTERLGDRLEKMIAEAESGIQDMTGKLVTGELELNNHSHEEKFIQLLILIQEVKAPPQKAKSEQLFKSFSQTDIAAILYLHFPEFRSNKINTIQRKVGELAARLKGHQGNQTQVKKLEEALQNFFYP